MAEPKHTEEAVKTAAMIDNKYSLSFLDLGHRENDGETITGNLEEEVYQKYENDIATIIDQETGLPALLAERDELRAKKKEYEANLQSNQRLIDILIKEKKMAMEVAAAQYTHKADMVLIPQADTLAERDMLKRQLEVNAVVEEGTATEMSKQTPGVTKAARKIDGLQLEWYVDCSTSPKFPDPDQRKSLIAAIIDEETAAERDRLREAVETAQQAIDKVFEIMDSGGKWEDAEIWLNNLAETNQAALAEQDRLREIAWSELYMANIKSRTAADTALDEGEK